MFTKTRPAFIKTVGADDSGIVEMVVATYDVDSWGDKIIPGAFAETLAEWKERGDPVPFIWSHRIEDPDMHIGYCLEIEERERDFASGAPAGLYVKAQIDMDEPKARKVFKLLKARRVTQSSFQYDVADGGYVGEGDERICELRKLKLYEVGPCLIGMNQQTTLLGVKAAKAGRVLSAKNEDLLRGAHESIGKVLAALEQEDANDNSEPKAASSNHPAKGEEPDGAKIEEPSPAKIEEPLKAKPDEPSGDESARLEALERQLDLTRLSLSLERD